MSSGHYPGQVLKWIIKETAVPRYNNQGSSQNESNVNNNTSLNSIDEDNSGPAVERLSDMPPAEREKWTNVILGNTEDINNRRALSSVIHDFKALIIKKSNKQEQKQSIEDIHQRNIEIRDNLEAIHHNVDKNEVVLVKLQCIQGLFQVILDYVQQTNKNQQLIEEEIVLLSCLILCDCTQNNPLLQNHIFSLNAIQSITESLTILCSTNDENIKIRSKFWSLLLVCCQNHNPNINQFFTYDGHKCIAHILLNIQKQS